MQLNLWALVASLFALMSCRSEATPIDPANDVDCAMLSFVFAAEAKRKNAPASQQSAMSTVRDWYAHKAGAFAKDPQSSQAFEARAKPALERINQDVSVQLDNMEACLNRARLDTDPTATQ